MHKKNSLFIWSCIFIVCLLGTSNKAFGQQRTVEDARSIADKFFTNAPRKSYSQFGIASFAGLQKVMTASDVLQTGMMSSEPFFVFSNEDAQPGFVIVSGDERMAEVLGYSLTETFDENNLPDGLMFLLQQYQKEWKYLQSIPVDQRTTTIKGAQRRIGKEGGVSPLLQTKWNQDAPYNNKCPLQNNERTVTGCVATAAAQVMKLYGHPATGTGSISYTTSTKKLNVTYDFSSKEFDWANMLDSYKSGYSTEQGDAVAELMAACGAMCKMDYTVDGSGTSAYSMMNGAIQYMGYDEDAALFYHDYSTEEYWQRTLTEELDSGRPLILTGTTDNNAGHCFIADGYEPADEYPSFHINWGWGGIADGYYKTTSLLPEQFGIGGVADCIKNNLSVILCFQPENNVVDLDSKFAGESFTISPNRGKPNTANNVDFAMKNVFNFASKTFSGYLNLYIGKEDGDTLYLGSMNFGEVPSLNGYGSVSFSVELPSTLSVGTYTFITTTSQTDSELESEVIFASGNPTYVVSDEDPDLSYYEANLQCTDLTVEKSAVDESFTMTLTQVANFASLSFTGNIKMAIADEKQDSVLITFGDATTITSLAHYNVLNDPLSLTATFPKDTIPDGHYRLGAAANQTNYRGWKLVKKFGLTNDYKITGQDEDATIECWVKNGKLQLAPTLVTEIQLSETTLTINALEKHTLTATVLPDDAVNKELTWESSNKKVATVYNGIITAVLGGECVITATAADGSGVKAECKVTVVNPVSNINYYVDNTLYQTVQCEYCQTIEPIDEPEKEGFTFLGWEDVPQLMPAHDIDIYGEFERNLYNITYMYEENVVNTQNLYFEADIPAYEYKPENDEYRTYTFLGWLLDGQEFTLTKMPARNLTLVANVSCVEGITSIEEDENNMTISTIAGIVLKTGATKSDLQKMPRGVYIVKTSNGISKVRL